MSTQLPGRHANGRGMLRGLACGSIGPELVSLTAPGRYNPQQTVECRITRLQDDAWLTELRVDLRLTEHGILRGADAEGRARTWLAQAMTLLQAGPYSLPRGIFTPHHALAAEEHAARISAQSITDAPAPANVMTVADRRAILEENARLVAAVRAARESLAAAFGEAGAVATQ